MALTDAERARIQAAIAAGRLPRHTPSGRLYLRLGPRSSVALTVGGDILTEAGTCYYAESGNPPPHHGVDQQQPLVSRANTDYIRDSGGHLRAVRHLMPDGTASLTRLGRRYFANMRTEYVVHVPVRIRGRHKDGTVYERMDYLPVNALGLQRIFADAALTHAQQIADVKRRVLHQLNVEEGNADTILMQISGETYYYRPDEEWLISRASTHYVDGHGVTQVQIRQPLTCLLVGAQSHLPFPEHILDEAFLELPDKLCVPRQLSALLKKPLAEVCLSFDELYGRRDWRDIGVDVDKIKEFCVKASLCLLYTSPSPRD